MELDFAMLADSLSVDVGGKPTIIGAGVDRVMAPSVPAMHALINVVMRGLLTPEEASRPHRLNVRLLSPDGDQLQTHDANAEPVTEQVTIFEDRIGVGIGMAIGPIVFPSYGLYTWELRWDDEEAPFKVLPMRLTPLPTP